jgi:mannosyltransferase OCH1-like enzyme
MSEKVLFTSYKCEKNDEYIQTILNQWSLLNPLYKVLYFSDRDVEIFFKETKYYNTYKLMRNGVAIADFFRICYINKYGGYWFDIDLEPIKIDIPNYGDIHLFDAGYKNISYMFIGGKPNQVLFEDVIKQVNKNILDNVKIKTQHVLDITGPRVIQNLICNELQIKNIDGCLNGDNIPKTYLQNTKYEFVYKKLNFNTTKTLIYNLLQKKYNKKAYQMYNFI